MHGHRLIAVAGLLFLAIAKPESHCRRWKPDLPSWTACEYLYLLALE